VTLTGRLDLDAVEDLAACADQICRSPVRTVIFDTAALSAVDEAGARTLAAAFRCLAAHGVAARVRGVGGDLQAMLDHLGLTLPAPPARPARSGRPGRAMALPAQGAIEAQPSAGLVGLAVALQGAARGFGIGHASRRDGGHDGVELPGLIRADAVKQRPPDLLDV
jgi:anti-anti-sigma regulatory factor